MADLSPAGGAGKPASKPIKLAPVQLVMRASAKEMAKELAGYAGLLLDLAKQLERQEKGQTFHMTLVHRYQHANCEISHRSDCTGGVHVMDADCNGGGDGG